MVEDLDIDPSNDPNKDHRRNEILPELKDLQRKWIVSNGAHIVPRHASWSSRRRRWQMRAWSLAAAVIDFLLVSSLACLFAIVFMAITKVHVTRFDFLTKPEVLRLLGPCLLALHCSYLLLFRVFAGCSAGEWACGLRLGQPHHRLSRTYGLKVLLRFFVVAATGFIVLPFLSLIRGQDLTGKWIDLPLVGR
ncbi:MAG: hypothetical protein C5B49_11020 [Bdellovibrio sp.]|nr:MAG: hypothetical protein C5B49_11020 [Bdellovibrio sp.]